MRGLVIQRPIVGSRPQRAGGRNSARIVAAARLALSPPHGCQRRNCADAGRGDIARACDAFGAAGGNRRGARAPESGEPDRRAVRIAQRDRGDSRPRAAGRNRAAGCASGFGDLGTGAEDNGVNAVMAIDAARGIREMGVKPRRTIRFVLFTGEEQGMWGSAGTRPRGGRGGSAGYVQRHAAAMARHDAAVIFDTGSGPTTGFFLSGREDLRTPLEKALSGVAGLGVAENLPDALDGTDHFDFLLSGVPNLVANQDAVPYL